jgi:formate dehydrogenase subunit gamma
MSKRRPVTVPLRVEPGSDLPAPERAAVLESVKEHRDAQGALLQVLHGIQDRLGWVPPRAVPLIAFELNLSRAEVHGVLSFYHYYRQSKPGQQVIYLCRAEACQASGSVALEAHAKRKLGVDFHGTSADGRYTLEPVYCLGNCACGPSMMIDKELHALVTPARFDELVAKPAAMAKPA